LESARKKIDEVLKMPQRELLEYLRETDSSLQPTDTIQVRPFEHGIKALYYHKDSSKPFKTRVYLKNIENSDLK
jgi:hypothetical protein